VVPGAGVGEERGAPLDLWGSAAAHGDVRSIAWPGGGLARADGHRALYSSVPDGNACPDGICGDHPEKALALRA
jgi:hypothetical protein